MHGTLFLSAKHRKPVNKTFAIVFWVFIPTESLYSFLCICFLSYECNTLIHTTACDFFYTDHMK